MLDFVGINVYRPIAYELASDVFPGRLGIAFARGHPKMSLSWRWTPKFRVVALKNGCASATVDVLAEDGDINDADRIMFLRGYLIELIPNCPELSKR